MAELSRISLKPNHFLPKSLMDAPSPAGDIQLFPGAGTVESLLLLFSAIDYNSLLFCSTANTPLDPYLQLFRYKVTPLSSVTNQLYLICSKYLTHPCNRNMTSIVEKDGLPVPTVEKNGGGVLVTIQRRTVEDIIASREESGAVNVGKNVGIKNNINNVSSMNSK